MKRYTVFMYITMNIFKMSILSKAIYRINAISIKSSDIFAKLEQLFSKFMGNCRRPQVTKTILRRITKMEVSCHLKSNFTTR